jgi:hypothetical protein
LSGKLVMNPQDRRQNDNEASEFGEAFFPAAEGERAGIRLSSVAILDWRRLRVGALPPSTGSALDGIANSDSGSRSRCACEIRPAVSVGCVWFPLTLALSLREREQPSCVFLKSGVAPPSPCAPRFKAETSARPRAFDSSLSGGRFSLSARERAGVRGKSLGPVDQIHAQPFDATLSLSPFQGERECTTEVWCILRTS